MILPPVRPGKSDWGERQMEKVVGTSELKSSARGAAHNLRRVQDGALVRLLRSAPSSSRLSYPAERSCEVARLLFPRPIRGAVNPVQASGAIGTCRKYHRRSQMNRAVRFLRLIVATVLVLTCTKLAFAGTAECFRDIRKDTKNTPSPLDDVIHDFGCPTIVCDSSPHNDGACQPGSQTIGGVVHYACMCDGLETQPMCLLAYKDTLGNSELGDGGGSGGTATCLRIECSHECGYQDTWVVIGDPEVPQKRNDCVCP